jgi:hypothetical protein
VVEFAPNYAAQKMMELGIQGGPLHRKYRIHLNHVTVAVLPENDEERLTEMFAGAYKHLRLMAPDPYDLALSKLERNSQKDHDDVRFLARSVPLRYQAAAGALSHRDAVASCPTGKRGFDGSTLD